MLPSAVTDEAGLALGQRPLEVDHEPLLLLRPAYSVANALRAFSDSSRKPKLKSPRQLPMPGLVMTSMRTMPASWYSAEYELVWKRIC